MIQLIQRFAGWFQLLFVVAIVGAAVMLSVSLKPDSSGRFSARAPDPVFVSDPRLSDPFALLDSEPVP